MAAGRANVALPFTLELNHKSRTHNADLCG